MRRAAIAGLVALSLCAVLLPVPLYLVALALFGLPHVLWELAFMRQRYGGRWPRWWWRLLGLALLLQAGLRAAYWLGSASALATQVADLLSLLVIALLVMLAPPHAGWRVRLAGALAALGLLTILRLDAIVPALLVLALLHNFTPVPLAWNLANESGDVRLRREAWLVTGIFVLPLLLGLLLTLAGTALPEQQATAPWRALLESQLPASWRAAYPSLLPALVLAQCLHYCCVIQLLPKALHRSSGQALMPRGWRLLALAVAALLSVYFLLDYGQARSLYAVAAGLHAWLEWPLLLMAFLARPLTREAVTPQLAQAQP